MRKIDPIREKVSRRRFLKAPAFRSRETLPGKPNILVIVTEDQRWNALGCAGNPIIRTLAMDRLAVDRAALTRIRGAE